MGPTVTELQGKSRVQFARHRRLKGVLAGVAVLAAGFALTGAAERPSLAPAGAVAEPVTKGGPATLRRLSEAQYRQSIEDIFGAGITVPGRFDPVLRDGGLLAIGDGKVAVSSAGFEQYELRAREIAVRVLSEERRQNYLTCAPKAPAVFDQACAAGFISKYGRLLYRRPLTQSEVGSVVNLAGTAANKSGSFIKGLEIGLSKMLASPNFIFRVEAGVVDPTYSGGLRLDDYSLASRISFLLWNAPPDTQLLDAVAAGALRQPAGLEREVDRMIASPRFEKGVRAFFSDMFAYDQFDRLSKEQSIFPKFSSQLARDAKEQALRTVVDLLITNKGDYRDLFATKKTFMNRNLGLIYKVRVDSPTQDGWMPYTFGPEDPRAGLLTMAAFLMLDPSHEGRSSPTIRGKTVRELLLCQPVPAPPANVNFTIVQDTANPLYKTARDRLSAHAENPVCAGCHKITDPIGLSLEHYDAIGQFRAQENGAEIDTSGQLDNKRYVNALEMTQILRDNSSIPSCVVQRAYEYGVGRAVTDGDEAWMNYAVNRFTNEKYVFPRLIRFIATSQAFRAVAGNGPGPKVKTANVAGLARTPDATIRSR